MSHRSHTKYSLLISLAIGGIAACGKVSEKEAISDGNDGDSGGTISAGDALNGDGDFEDKVSGAAVSTGGIAPTGGSGSEDNGSGVEENCLGDCEPGALGGAGSACEGDGCETHEPTCVPDCDEKVCGTDGCDGSCGTCPGDMICSEAQNCELGARPETEMSSMPGGTFVMGAEDLDSMTSPAHERTVAPFSIDRTEVTARAYDACIAAGVCEAVENNGGPGQNSGSTDFLDFPVNYVTFDQASQFCEWMGKRIPTETEWEYAAGGALGYLYPWGSGPPAWQACTTASAGVGEAPASVDDLEYDYDHGCKVKEFPPGAHGLYDMAGGVWEFVDAPWCAYSSETESGYFEGNNSLLTCIEGPVLRGSGFTTSLGPITVRVSYRELGSGAAVNGHQGVGFRCAKSN